MKIEKICEYLNEIGILEYENINIFLEIYSKLNNDKYLRTIDRLKDTLIIYLNNNFIKNNKISQLCQSILSSFNNYQLILKYRTLNNMNNILTNKIHNKYIDFFLNISFYLLKENKTSKRSLSTKKAKIIKKNMPRKIDKYDDSEGKNKLNEENNEELISSDDERECTFTPQINKNFKGYKKPLYNNVESHVYYSPAFNIASKFPINNYQNLTQARNNNNTQKNNINIINNNPDNSYYSNYSNYTNYNNNNNYNNLNISNDSRTNRSYMFNDNNYLIQKQKFNNDNMLKDLNNEYNNNYNTNNNYNNRFLESNNYNNDMLRSYNKQNMNNKYIYNNYNYPNNNDNNRNYDDFFNKELEHIQRVKDKIQNMRIEKLNKIKEECTFQPNINTNYKGFYQSNKQNENNIYQQPKYPQQQSQPTQSHKTLPLNNNNKKLIQLKRKEPLETIKENNNTNNNTNNVMIQKKKGDKKRSYSEKKKGIKIIEDLSLARKRRTEKTKKLMKERNFTPKIKKTDKYKDNIKMSFEDRRLKSMELKNKYKKAKNDENKIKNIELVLTPGEMVRFKENNNFNNNNDIYNNEGKGEDKNVENDQYNIKEDMNINEKGINDNNKDNIYNNNEDNESMSKNINKKDIEKNKLLLMDKIKGEHKIGFKMKKDDEENENKENKKEIEDKKEEILKDDNKEKNEEKEENDDFENKLINKKEEYTFNTNGFHSNALKAILDKNKN